MNKAQQRDLRRQHKYTMSCWNVKDSILEKPLIETQKRTFRNPGEVMDAVRRLANTVKHLRRTLPITEEVSVFQRLIRRNKKQQKHSMFYAKLAQISRLLKTMQSYDCAPALSAMMAEVPSIKQMRDATAKTAMSLPTRTTVERIDARVTAEAHVCNEVISRIVNAAGLLLNQLASAEFPALSITFLGVLGRIRTLLSARQEDLIQCVSILQLLCDPPGEPIPHMSASKEPGSRDECLSMCVCLCVRGMRRLVMDKDDTGTQTKPAPNLKHGSVVRTDTSAGKQSKSKSLTSGSQTSALNISERLKPSQSVDTEYSDVDGMIAMDAVEGDNDDTISNIASDDGEEGGPNLMLPTTADRFWLGGKLESQTDNQDTHADATDRVVDCVEGEDSFQGEKVQDADLIVDGNLPRNNLDIAVKPGKKDKALNQDRKSSTMKIGESTSDDVANVGKRKKKKNRKRKPPIEEEEKRRGVDINTLVSIDRRDTENLYAAESTGIVATRGKKIKKMKSVAKPSGDDMDDIFGDL
ncbi:hypothetical protein SARC_03132 [Sphaeroforma arctica JP610]|uniref:Nucleolus and neural progenitor protein-like N-terminal domain-containing protein n=1 Tax=Sphaeroforma arctica JP610 TaxID=667725 RepID=A0A0L0G704_9EUKA|nr:hypothetical protein SARC_03132 [Sphaeroforma arctica JP610]KNC84641.1 hypothetical protein SARC_03132 [Sphaeroforma arctica JP610]|eukprot:XP_014158543.1 hypothetical protein SARC_03132 [Sphaeroforma arctica JP610]